MRAMLVTGAAFAAIDKRVFLLLISELLTENTTLDGYQGDFQRNVLCAFSVEKKLLELLENNLVSIRVRGLQYSSYRAESVEK